MIFEHASEAIGYVVAMYVSLHQPYPEDDPGDFEAYCCICTRQTSGQQSSMEDWAHEHIQERHPERWLHYLADDGDTIVRGGS